MNTKSLILLLCLLGFSSLAFAGIDVSFEQVNADGQIVGNESWTSTFEKGLYTCAMILYTKENANKKDVLLPVLSVFGPPYDGAIDNLDSLGGNPTYFHNLRKIVYQGSKCNCKITAFEGTENTGKSKEYRTRTCATISKQKAIYLDSEWSSKIASLSIECNA